MNSVFFSGSILNDYLGEIVKLSIILFSIFCFFLFSNFLTFQKINRFEYVIIIIISILGLLILCSSNDILISYLAIELQSLSFYVLAAFKQNSIFSVESGLKYFIFGAFASSLFLFGFSIIYGITGCTNFDDLFTFLRNDSFYLQSEASQNFLKTGSSTAFFTEKYLDFLNIFYGFYLFSCSFFINFESSVINDFYQLNLLSFSSIFKKQFCIFDLNQLNGSCNFSLMFWGSNLYLKSYLVKYELKEILSPIFVFPFFNLKLYYFSLKISFLLILFGLLFKLAVVPFHTWLPDIYEGSPLSSASFFAVVPKIAIFILLVRLTSYSYFSFDVNSWLMLLGTFSIFYGSLIALEERKLKSLLAFSAISNLGYAILAYSVGSFESIRFVFCYLFIYMLSTFCLWSILLLSVNKKTVQLNNKYNKEIALFSNLLESNPILAFLFSMSLFSIAGIPPFLGFLVKFGIFYVVIQSSVFFIAIISIVSSVIATFYYLRIIKVLFFEKKVTKVLFDITTTKYTFYLIFLFFLLVFLFFHPTFIYLTVYKINFFLF
jgi:NADH:ubiquinone oxidoreductase subunit 2 (subunit N)